MLIYLSNLSSYLSLPYSFFFAPFMYLSPYLPISLSVHLYLSISTCLSLSICLYYLSLADSTSLSLCRHASVIIMISNYLSLKQSAYYPHRPFMLCIKVFRCLFKKICKIYLHIREARETKKTAEQNLCCRKLM